MYIHPQKHVQLLVALVAVYGFLEIGTLMSTRSKVRVGSRDLTFYAVTVPAMLSLWVPLLAMLFRAPFSLVFYIAGIVLMVCGIIIRIKGVAELQGFFSTAVEKLEGHVLIDRGLHALIRHPAYLGTLMISFSIVVALRASWWMFLFPVLTVAGVLVRIRKEEEFLVRQLPGYGDYMKKTRRLIPGIY